MDSIRGAGRLEALRSSAVSIVCVCACARVRSSGPIQHPFYVTLFVTLISVPSEAILQTPLRRFPKPHLLLLLLGAVDHLVPLNHSLGSLLVPIYRKSRYLEVDAARALSSDCPASTPANASLRQGALDGVAGAAPNTLSARPSSRLSVAAAAAAAAPAAAASAAPDKPLVSRARSRRKSSSDKPLVGDTAADELQRQARIASDQDHRGSGGSLGRDSSSDENNRREDRTDERQAPVSHTSSSMASEASAAAADVKMHKWRWGISRVMRRFKGPKGSGGSLGRDLSSGENDRREDSTDERQAPVSHTSSSMASEASAAADDPKIHKRGWGIGRVLRRFKDWLMSGLDAEEDAEVDGPWGLTPMHLDGFE